MVNHTLISGNRVKDGRTSRHQKEGGHPHRLIKRGGADHSRKTETLSPSNKYGNSTDEISELKGAAATSAFREDMLPYLLVGGFILIAVYTSNA